MRPDPHFPARVRRLLNADAVCFWRLGADGSALPGACDPPALLQEAFVRPPLEANAVATGAGKLARRLLPLALRAQLEGSGADGFVLSAMGQARDCGFFAIWRHHVGAPADIEPLATFVCEQWAHTARHQAVLEEHDEATAQLHGLISALPHSVVIVPNQSQQGLINPAAAALLGIAAGWVDRSALADALNQLLNQADNAAEIRSRIEPLLRGHAGVLSGCLLKFSARSLTLKLTLAPIDEYRAEGWVWLIEDATTEIRSKERLESAAAAGIIGVWDWDVVNNRLEWDQVMYRLYGVREEDFTGAYEAWASALHPEDKAHTEGEAQAALRGEREYAPEFRVIWPDGTIHHLKCVALTTFDGDGRPLRMIGVNYDLTEQKAVEQALVRERNKADQANQAKSDFLAKMSHELRTPMNGIRGYLQLARDESSLARVHYYLDAALKSSQLMSALLNDVLDFSKIEAGKLELERRGFNLRDMLDTVCNLHQAAINARSADVILRQELADGLPRHVLGDELRLSQVIHNLLSNAVKFTHAGEIVLRVDRASAQAPTDALRFEVSDSGIGMNQEQIGRLFNAFEQSDNSTSRRYGGSGLGLVISQQLVRLMGGDPMEVRSIPGQGSCMAFTLALAPAQDQDEMTQPMRPPASPASLEGMSVLLVEDNPTNIEIAASMLEARGAEVAIATSGQGALDVLRELGPLYDLVLMDVQMPGMDGLEATRHIRANPEWHDLPVVAMTANAREEDRRACEQAGMVGFISKPIERDELLRVVVLHRRAG
ncbi:MAG: hypothetical protein RLZZ22_1232 [Pseudomonadota bacterium]|jgi:PAS domain S-box-containing protein